MSINKQTATAVAVAICVGLVGMYVSYRAGYRSGREIGVRDGQLTMTTENRDLRVVADDAEARVAELYKFAERARVASHLGDGWHWAIYKTEDDREWMREHEIRKWLEQQREEARNDPNVIPLDDQ